MGVKNSTLRNLFVVKYLKRKNKNTTCSLYLCDIIQEPGRHGSPICLGDIDTCLRASGELTLALMSSTATLYTYYWNLADSQEPNAPDCWLGGHSEYFHATTLSEHHLS